MNYHRILHDDTLNGDGLRVVLFLSGCDHHCEGCHNPQTWDPNSGKPFDIEAYDELWHYLSKDYTSGITFSGGDPLNPANIDGVYRLCKEIKENCPEKTIWLYSGYDVYEILTNPEHRKIMEYVDVLVDGKFKKELLDVKYPWAGSTNQRVIDMQRTLKMGTVVMHVNS